MPPLTTLVARLRQLPGTRAVALGGSRGAGTGDASSDYDLYVSYDAAPPPAPARSAIAAALADPARPIEIDNLYWETSDEWTDAASGLKIDLMYRHAQWIEGELDRVLVHFGAWTGYTTALWYNVRHSQPLYDRDGWYAALQTRAAAPYPDALRRAILAKNYPILRDSYGGYRDQVEKAIQRQDRVSLNHRTAAFLASYFDILFAVNGVLHPGEKRLLAYAQNHCPHRPAGMAAQVEGLLVSTGAPWQAVEALHYLDALVDGLDALLTAGA